MKTAFLIVAVVALFTAPLAGCAAFQNPNQEASGNDPTQKVSENPDYEVSMHKLKDAMVVIVSEDNGSEKDVEYWVVVFEKDDNIIIIDIRATPFTHTSFHLLANRAKIIILEYPLASASLLKRFMSDRVQEHFPPEVRKRIAEAMNLIPTALRPKK